MRMESLEQLSLVGKNCLPPTSEICSVEGIFKDIYAIIFIPEDKICMQMAYLQKSESKKKEETKSESFCTNFCLPGWLHEDWPM